MKTVREIMNKNVVCFSPEDTVFKLAKVLSERNISGAPVVENEKLVGIISISDIVRFMRTNLKIGGLHKIPSLSLLVLDLLRTGKNYFDLKKEMERISKIKVGNLMRKKVVCISPEASIFDAAYMIEKYDVNRLPVVENGKVVGIVARADLIKALVE